MKPTGDRLLKPSVSVSQCVVTDDWYWWIEFYSNTKQLEFTISQPAWQGDHKTKDEAKAAGQRVLAMLSQTLKRS